MGMKLVYPDRTLQSAAPDLGLKCLYRSACFNKFQYVSMSIDYIGLGRDTDVNPLLIRNASLTLCLFSTTKTRG